jgi:hypothetical protein
LGQFLLCSLWGPYPPHHPHCILGQNQPDCHCHPADTCPPCAHCCLPPHIAILSQDHQCPLSPWVRCPYHLSGLHMEANHRQLTGCCWGNPLAKPTNQLHQRELHALIPHTVSTAKGHTVHLTDNALTGSIGLTRLSFPHGSPCPTSGQRPNQHFQWAGGSPNMQVRRCKDETRNCDPLRRCECRLSLALAPVSS